MNIKLLTYVRNLFNVPTVPRGTNRHNQRGWIKARRILNTMPTNFPTSRKQFTKEDTK
jgi:hypothetical protein